MCGERWTTLTVSHGQHETRPRPAAGLSHATTTLHTARDAAVRYDDDDDDGGGGGRCIGTVT